MLAKGLWLSFLWTLNQDLGPLHHLTLCLDANSRLSSEQSTDVLTLLPSQKLHQLFDIWMVTQGCFPWALSWGSCPFTAALHFLLFKILTFVSYLIQYFHQAVKFLVHSFFQRALPLTALSISWGCYKSFLPVAVLGYSACVICSFHILIKLSKPWIDRKSI